MTKTRDTYLQTVAELAGIIARDVGSDCCKTGLYPPQRQHTEALEGLLEDEQWIREHAHDVMRFTANPAAGEAIPAGTPWSEVLTACATAAMGADVLHAAERIWNRQTACWCEFVTYSGPGLAG